MNYFIRSNELAIIADKIEYDKECKELRLYSKRLLIGFIDLNTSKLIYNKTFMNAKYYLLESEVK